MKLNKELVCMINTLYLLEQGEKTYLQLWKSHLFYNYKDLTFALKRLSKAGCVESVPIGGYKGIHIFLITQFGRKMLNVFPNWKPKKVVKVAKLPSYRERKQKEDRALKKLEDRVVVPLGRHARSRV